MEQTINEVNYVLIHFDTNRRLTLVNVKLQRNPQDNHISLLDKKKIYAHEATQRTRSCNFARF